MQAISNTAKNAIVDVFTTIIDSGSGAGYFTPLH